MHFAKEMVTQKLWQLGWTASNEDLEVLVWKGQPTRKKAGAGDTSDSSSDEET